jgi:hypothetical protein
VERTDRATKLVAKQLEARLNEHIKKRAEVAVAAEQQRNGGAGSGSGSGGGGHRKRMSVVGGKLLGMVTGVGADGEMAAMSTFNEEDEDDDDDGDSGDARASSRKATTAPVDGAAGADTKKAKTKTKAKVHFGTLSVHHHERVCGGSVTVPSSGPPLGLGWAKTHTEHMPSFIAWDDAKAKMVKEEEDLARQEHDEEMEEEAKVGTRACTCARACRVELWYAHHLLHTRGCCSVLWAVRNYCD